MGMLVCATEWTSEFSMCKERKRKDLEANEDKSN